jgi:ERCC4-related helicase
MLRKMNQADRILEAGRQRAPNKDFRWGKGIGRDNSPRKSKTEIKLVRDTITGKSKADQTRYAERKHDAELRAMVQRNFGSAVKRTKKRQGLSPERNQAFREALLSGESFLKKGSARGHWRRLEPTSTGHDQAGNEVSGKTWVHTGRMKPSAKPMAHQQSGVKAVTSVKRPEREGTVFAHGTGTGKTFTAIASFEELKRLGKTKRALVLTPAGLRENFAGAVSQFTNSNAQELTRPTQLDPSVEYAIVSYDAFRNNPQGWLDALQPDTIIGDEIQKAINESSKTHKAVFYARSKVPHFMGLTASVVQNQPEELSSVLRLAKGEHAPYQSRKAFRRKHVKSVKTKQQGIFGGTVRKKELVNLDALKKNVGTTIHYIEDLDADQKPPKHVESVEVPMSKEQIELYRMSMRGIDPKVVEKIKRGEAVSQRQAMNVFTRLMRARQVSNSLHTVTGMDPAVAAEKTPKIKKLLDDAVKHLEATPDGKVIMYSNLVSGGVDVLEAGLMARGIEHGKFIGRGNPGVTEESRQQAVKDYKAGKTRVILITGAGAEGLSLGNTTMVQVLDGHYNPERTAQAEARGVRAKGQSHRAPEERKVLVKRYVSTLPRTFWQKVTFQRPEKSVGQWVYATAQRKAETNRKIRDALQETSRHHDRRRSSTLYRVTHRRNP